MANRTYDWNGHTNLPISYPDLSDFHMAGKVRMLMRSDLDHEGVVCGARDRIMCLSKEKAYLTAEAERLRALLSESQDMHLSALRRNCALRDALGKISSPTQTEGLLWWQVEARAALDATETIGGDHG